MLFLIYTLVILYAVSSGNAYRRVCYYTNWAQYRQEPQKFFPEDIDPTLCDYFTYTFAKMEGNKLIPLEWNDFDMYVRFNTHVKNGNSNAKTLLAVGGWTFDLTKMTDMLATKANRQEFVTTSIAYIKTHGFDGLDLDFEYPGSRGSPFQDKHRFTLLCQELRTAFNAEGSGLLLTAAVGAGKSTIDNGYEIGLISQELDYISLMAYDLQGSWNDFTGHNSPLYGRADEAGTVYETLNQNWVISYWLAGGCPREKLVLGMAAYGRCFSLVNPALNGMGAKTSGSCGAGNYTGEAGFLAYYEVCRLIENGTEVWHDEHMVPYGYKDNTWIGYDNIRSLQNKVNLTINEGLGGFMIWTLDLDDFNGQQCSAHGDVRYPLLRAMNAVLDEANITTATTTNTTAPPITSAPGHSTTTAIPITPAPGHSTTTALPITPAPGHSTTAVPASNTNAPGCENTPIPCTGLPNGQYPDPYGCQSFYYCVEGIPTKRNCTSVLLYNPKHKVCDWPYNINNTVLCCKCPENSTNGCP